jgi:hypothetical protein
MNIQRIEKLSCIMILVASFLPVLVMAQIGFERHYGTPYYDEAYYVQQTTDKGYVIAGCSDVAGGDMYLIKTDAFGDTLWTRTFGGDRDDGAWSAEQTKDGGYVLAGYTWSFAADRGLHLYIVKTDSVGEEQWQHIYDITGKAHSIKQTLDGGYIVAGDVEGNRSDLLLLKIDSNGDLIWQRSYGGYFNEEGHSVLQTADGGYVAAGYTFSFGSGNRSVYMIRTDSNGDTLWTRTYSKHKNSSANCIQETFDDGFILTGYTDIGGRDNSDIYLIKTDSNGDSLWTKAYGDSGTLKLGASVDETYDGGYIIAGQNVKGRFGGEMDVYLLKTDSSGNTLWTRTFGKIGEDYANCVQQTLDGGYIITGLVNKNGRDFYLIKTNENGLTTRREPVLNYAPVQFSLAQNYPNPFNPTTTIDYALAKEGHVRIEIYDILGRHIKTLVKTTQDAGQYQTSWNGTNEMNIQVAAGVYFYKMQVGDFVAVNKLVLVK